MAIDKQNNILDIFSSSKNKGAALLNSALDANSTITTEEQKKYNKYCDEIRITRDFEY